MSARRLVILAAATAALFGAVAMPTYAAEEGSKGRFDTFSAGGHQGRLDTFTEGARQDRFDVYAEGARANRFDVFSEGAAKL